MEEYTREIAKITRTHLGLEDHGVLIVRKIYRYEVPVDDRWHDFELHTDPLHVASRRPDVVEFWAGVVDEADFLRRRQFRVFGTGHPLPAGCRYWGTAPVGPLVWHLVEAVLQLDAEVRS